MIELPRPAAWAKPEPAPLSPGPSYEPPLAATTTTPAGAPQIYEHSGDAGPDQNFFVVGTGLSERVLPGDEMPLTRRAARWNSALTWSTIATWRSRYRPKLSIP